MSYSSHKYDDVITETLSDLISEWSTSTSGDSEAPTGWFSEPITIGTDSDAHDVLPTVDRIAESHGLTIAEVSEILTDIVGTWIVSGDSQGFHYSQRYDSEEAARVAFDAADADYARWSCEHENAEPNTPPALGFTCEDCGRSDVHPSELV